MDGSYRGNLTQEQLEEQSGIIDFENLEDDSEDILDLDNSADNEGESAAEEYEDAPPREAKEATPEEPTDPTRNFHYPLITETKAPGGIPSQCLEDLWFQSHWYIRLRARFLVSEWTPFQCGILHGFLGVYHERAYHLTIHPFMIHPYSDFSALWNFTIGIMLYCNTFYSPYMIAFDIQIFLHSAVQIVNFLITTFLLMDIVLNFFTGVKDPYSRTIILDPVDVAYRYLKGWFFYDLITRFPIDAIMIHQLSPEERRDKTKMELIRIIALVTRSLRYQKMFQILCRLAETISFRSLMAPWAIKLVSLLLFTIHWHACFHWLLPDITNAHLSHPKPHSWVTVYGVWNKPKFEQYINSYLRSLSNLLTLDGGSFTPRELEEILCTTLGIFLSVSLFGYFISSFTTLLGEVNASSENYNQMLELMQDYLTFQKIPLQLQEKVLQYFEKRHRGHMFADAAIMSTLSSALQTEITCHNCRTLLEKVPLFKQLPPGIIVNLAERLQYELYIPKDILMTANTPGDCMYFIQDGEVDVLTEMGSKIETLRDGDFFGETSLITGEYRTKTVVARAACEVYKLTRQNFREAVETSPQVYNEIVAIAKMRLEAEMKKTVQMAERAERIRNWKQARKQLKETIGEESQIAISTSGVDLVGESDDDTMSEISER